MKSMPHLLERDAAVGEDITGPAPRAGEQHVILWACPQVLLTCAQKGQNRETYPFGTLWDT